MAPRFSARVVKRLVVAVLIVSVIFLIWNWERLIHPSRLVLSGTLELTEHSVGARAPGRIATLLVDEGAQVSQGQLLATLDRNDQAMRDDERVIRLYEHGGATRQEVEQAELALQDQQVASPVDGVILIKVHEVGEVVGAGTPIVVIGQTRQPWVRVFIREGLVSQVRVGMPATLGFDGLARVFKGHVSYVAPRAEFTPRNVQSPEERMAQTFAVKVTLDEPQSYLRPGVAADVTIDVRQ